MEVTTPPPGRDGTPADGLQRLLRLVDEAQRFHQGKPASRRRVLAVRTRRQRLEASSDTASTLTASGDNQPAAPTNDWQDLRLHIQSFWNSDLSPHTAKYTAVKQWLVPLRLWELDVTWEQCRRANSSGFAAETHAARATKLQSLPPGQLFF